MMSWIVECFCFHYLKLKNCIQIGSYFSDKLLGVVRDCVLHMREMDGHRGDEHSSPASANHRGDAALEFIKHICAVLALDQNVQHDILVILYRIVNFGDPSFQLWLFCYSIYFCTCWVFARLMVSMTEDVDWLVRMTAKVLGLLSLEGFEKI